MTRTRARIDRDYSAQTSELIDFGMTDGAGRAIGASMVFTPEARTADEGGRMVVLTQTLGQWVSYSVQVTRDGVRFGASQKGALAVNMGHAREQALAKVEAARVRYAKKAA